MAFGSKGSFVVGLLLGSSLFAGKYVLDHSGTAVIAAQQTSEKSGLPSCPQPSESWPRQDVNQVQQSLDDLHKKFDRFESSLSIIARGLSAHTAQVSESRTTMPSTPAPPPSIAPAATHPAGIDWLAKLDSKARNQVEQVFKNNAARMKATLQRLGELEHVDPIRFRELVEENQENLKRELEGVLSSEDYEAFIQSLPPPPAPVPGTIPRSPQR